MKERESKSLHNLARKWIDIANLLADEGHPPAPDQAGSDIRERVVARFRRIPLSQWPMGLIRSGTKPPPLSRREFVNLLTGRPVSTGFGLAAFMMVYTRDSAPVDPAAVYELAHSVAAALAKIVAALSDKDLARKGRMYVHLPPRSVADSIVLEANGRMKIFSSGDFARFLEDLRLVGDLRRLRRCAICPRFFFAKRTDQSACSRTHAKTQSMQNWREGRGKDYEVRRQIRLAKEELQAKKLAPPTKLSIPTPMSKRRRTQVP